MSDDDRRIVLLRTRNNRNRVAAMHAVESFLSNPENKHRTGYTANVFFEPLEFTTGAPFFIVYRTKNTITVKRVGV